MLLPIGSGPLSITFGGMAVLTARYCHLLSVSEILASARMIDKLLDTKWGPRLNYAQKSANLY